MVFIDTNMFQEQHFTKGNLSILLEILFKIKTQNLVTFSLSVFVDHIYL